MAENILGAGAFRRELNRSKPINMNIFEVTLYFMSLILEKNQSVDAQKIESGLRRVIVSPEFSDYIGNSREQKEKVYGRFNLIVSLFEEISND